MKYLPTIKLKLVLCICLMTSLHSCTNFSGKPKYTPPVDPPACSPAKKCLEFARGSTGCNFKGGDPAGRIWKVTNIHPTKSIRATIFLQASNNAWAGCPGSTTFNITQRYITKVISPKSTTELYFPSGSFSGSEVIRVGICSGGAPLECACDAYWCSSGQINNYVFGWYGGDDTCFLTPAGACEGTTSTSAAISPKDPEIKPLPASSSCNRMTFAALGATTGDAKGLREYFDILTKSPIPDVVFNTDISSLFNSGCGKRQTKIEKNATGVVKVLSVGPDCTNDYNFVPPITAAGLASSYCKFDYKSMIEGTVTQAGGITTIDFDTNNQRSVWIDILIDAKSVYQNDIIKKIHLNRKTASMRIEGNYVCFEITNIPTVD